MIVLRPPATLRRSIRCIVASSEKARAKERANPKERARVKETGNEGKGEGKEKGEGEGDSKEKGLATTVASSEKAWAHPLHAPKRHGRKNGTRKRRWKRE